MHALNEAPGADAVAASLTLARPGVAVLPLSELMGAANALRDRGEIAAAAQLYADWIAHSDSPLRHFAHFNRGTLLALLQRHDEVEQAYRDALALEPDFPQARLNLGHQLERRGRFAEALQHWQHVARLPSGVELPTRLHALNNCARLLETLHRYPEADACMRISLALKADQGDVLQHYVHLRQKQCEWPLYAPVAGCTANQLLVATSALAMLSASDDPALQLMAAQRFVQERVPKVNEPALHTRGPARSGKLRIGYLSGDLCLHAVGLLTVELLELHDRERFEVFGFCWSRDDGTPLRRRIVEALDHHVRIAHLDDAAAALLITQLGIDVLVDLQGLTQGARPGILARRPAPVQVSYLGFPGCSGLPGVDWIVADPYVMPAELLPYHTEQPLYVPHCYQVSDRQRQVGPTPSRAAAGLPEGAFVYCSFNNNFKFTEGVFQLWMRVLAQVPNSVLWLLADNDTARDNMLRAADAAGVARDRLIFAPRVAPDAYLARFRLADLVLDTFPYNAGTTASDVLWVGTPILTRSGRSYISRMAGSLLHAVGLPELAVENEADYERLAVLLGRQPQRIASYKRYLAEEGRRSLFDVPARVRDLEDAFAREALKHRPALEGPAGQNMVARQEPFFDDDFGSRPAPGPDAGMAAPAPRPEPPVLTQQVPAELAETATPAAPPLNEAALETDPLLHAIAWITAHHGKPHSPHVLASGLSLETPMEPHQAIRALRDHGFRAGLIQRPIGVIHDMLLPAVLLLKHGDACVLARRLPATQGGHGERFEVVMPGPTPQGCVASEAELAPEYSGFAIAASPEIVAPVSGGSPAEEPSLHDPGSHWLWGTLRRFLPYYRAGMVASLLSNVLMIAIGLVTSVVFDRVIPHQAMVTLWALAAGGLVAQIFDFTARQLRAHLIDMAGKKADTLIGSLLFRQTLNVRLEHRPESAGSYAHVLAQIEVVRDFFASASLSALSDLPFIVLFIAMAFIIGGPLGWVLVGAIPVILGSALLIQGRLRRSTASGMARQADLQGLLVEAVEGLEDLKASGAQGRFLQRYEDATAMAAEQALRARSLSSLANNISGAAQQLITLVMLVWGVYLIKDGVITGGALIGAVMFAGRAVGPLGSVVSLANRYQGARTAMAALDRLMNQPTERVHGRAYVANHKVQGRIGLQDVSFSYPASGDTPAPKVLKDVTLRFAPGERVAILGRIGSGKSTVLRLLAGLYQPTEGMVDVDGIDLRQLDPADFRVRVGFVSQEPRLFNGTLRENVLMGRAAADASHLPEVAKVTGLDRVAAQHPLGWDQPVGEMGARLSGGQRQLVALARCLITRPQILLMDEPTSSMDAQSETLFLRQLKAAVGNCTMVLITHRPAALDLVNRVVVIDNGKVLIDGPKPQVLAALAGTPVPPLSAGPRPPAQPAGALRGVAA